MSAPPGIGRQGGGAEKQDKENARRYDARAGDAVVKSGKYLRPRGKLLGRIQLWGLDVYEGSPQQWKDSLYAEVFDAAE